MAASWLKRTALSLNGYANPDYSSHCFIGWQYYSKTFTEPTGKDPYTYQTFATMFYYYALVKGYTIKDALNKASINYIGAPFNQTQIYNGYDYNCFPSKIRVWGDSSMTLP
jgi:hypothetical protein